MKRVLICLMLLAPMVCIAEEKKPSYKELRKEQQELYEQYQKYQEVMKQIEIRLIQINAILNYAGELPAEKPKDEKE